MTAKNGTHVGAKNGTYAKRFVTTVSSTIHNSSTSTMVVRSVIAPSPRVAGNVVREPQNGVRGPQSGVRGPQSDGLRGNGHARWKVGKMV